MESKVSRMVALIEQQLGKKLPVEAPKLRVVSDAAPAMSEADRLWFCDQVRFLARVYDLEWFVRQEIRGFMGLESLPDDDLRRVFTQVGRAVECIREGVSFEDAGLIRHEDM